MSDCAVTIDIPVVRAIVARHGRARGLEIVGRLADECDHEAATAAFEALDSKIERRDPEDGTVHIESVFAIHERIDAETGEADPNQTVYWDNGGLVMFGRAIPATAAVAAVGSMVDSVVVHPFVTGLVISGIDGSPTDDGRTVVVIDLESTTCALADAHRHIGDTQ